MFPTPNICHYNGPQVNWYEVCSYPRCSHSMWRHTFRIKAGARREQSPITSRRQPCLRLWYADGKRVEVRLLHCRWVFRHRGHEAIATAGNRRNVARMLPAVLQLDPQITHVPVDHIAFGHVVGAPQLVQDLIAG